MTSATSDSMARDDVAGRRALLGDQREQAVARLGERREDLERLEGGGQALAVALVARAADDARTARRRGRPRRRTAARRRARGAHERVDRPRRSVWRSGQAVTAWPPSTRVSAARGPTVERPPRRRPYHAAYAVERIVHPCQRLVAPQQRDRLEDTG